MTKPDKRDHLATQYATMIGKRPGVGDKGVTLARDSYLAGFDAASPLQVPILTKKEYIAICAMQGLLASGAGDNFTINGTKQSFDTTAVIIADALIAELEKQR